MQTRDIERSSSERGVLGNRRGIRVNIEDVYVPGEVLSADELAAFERFDLLYRCACALLYNYVPTSGHPGGSISSGRFVAALLFDAMDYDLARPDREDADIVSYAAGHKALGLYAMWALRNEIARAGAAELVPADIQDQLRLEDLLGFRRNPVTRTPLVERFRSKALDGHPTPATPFVKLATGASGVGVGSSIGLAWAAADYFGANAPRVHIVEGEAGMTPGRVGEAMAAAGTAGLSNVVLHVDWNQSSIDSDRVCREGERPGDYVQWDPVEFALMHDWNAIYVPRGSNFEQILAGQRMAAALENGQPTAMVYRTVKGWQYGVEGKASHGAGHKLCSAGFYEAMRPLRDLMQVGLPTCDASATSCRDGADAAVVERCFWEALSLLREAVGRSTAMISTLGGRLRAAKARVDGRARRSREAAPKVDALFAAADELAEGVPQDLMLSPGAKTTLRGELGRVLNWLNRRGEGAIVAAAADLLDSTSIAKAADGFPAGYYHRFKNSQSRLLATGGICEDAMCAILGGISTFGRHMGVGASYGAFIAPLGHIAARLHAIGNQAREGVSRVAYRPFMLVCGHAGLKTGEDGPTHADPQCLQLLQENFPPGTMVTLTPWEPQELAPLLGAAIRRRPAVIAPFVTRPAEVVLDRAALGLAPAEASAQGVYRLRAARGKSEGVVVLQESGVAYAFVRGALPELLRAGVDLDVYYIASAELFEALSAEEKERVYPEEAAGRAMGITGFTLATMYRWVTSRRGREATLHPYRKGHFLGSGQADRVLEEAGLDGASQAEAVLRFVRA